MKDTFSQAELEIINNIISSKQLKTLLTSFEDLSGYTKDEIWSIVDGLGDLIGYDPVKDDIDSLGLQADTMIEKLIRLLIRRGEFD